MENQESPLEEFAHERPKNWLTESILVTVLCCLPFGIVGIVHAASVNTKYDAGDYEGAIKASNEAGKWTKIGFYAGLAYLLVVSAFAIGSIMVQGF